MWVNIPPNSLVVGVVEPNRVHASQELLPKVLKGGVTFLSEKSDCRYNAIHGCLFLKIQHGNSVESGWVRWGEMRRER